jgi:hypothetical protein
MTYDIDAAAYIAAVESADTETLEAEIKDAINDFIVGCKADGIWDAIKASCILAGARTLAGALVPLRGVAPTSFDFVDEDYNRKNGLAGNGTTKYLNSNRNNNADPQDSNHNLVWISSVSTSGIIIGGSDAGGETGSNNVSHSGASVFFRNRASAANSFTGSALGLFGTSRSSSASYTYRLNGVTASITRASQVPANTNVSIFASGTVASFKATGRLTFYSIGEALDMALLDARLTTLLNDFEAALAIKPLVISIELEPVATVMPSIAEEIISAIDANVAAMPSVVDTYRSRADAFSRRESGSVVVEPGNSTAQEVNTCRMRWDDEIMIGIYTCGDVPDRLADPIRREIHASVMAYRQVLQVNGIPIVDITAGTVTRELEAGDKPAMWTVLRYLVAYHTLIDDLAAQ